MSIPVPPLIKVSSMVGSDIDSPKYVESSLRKLASNPDLTLMDEESTRALAYENIPITFVIIGASGDLAFKKTFPALFSLYYHDLLPKRFLVVGYARSKLELTVFRGKIASNLKARSVISEDMRLKRVEQFCDRIHYVSGQYDSQADFANLNSFLHELENGEDWGRVFYLAIPPTMFGPSMKSIKASAVPKDAFCRIIIEKPFGRDLETYHQLQNEISASFDEEAIYRIDHYVGKEMVQNIVTLRFGNYMFESLWDRSHIRDVHIIFEEDFGLEGRAGYFDTFGIIRDIMQNHLLQVLAYIAMDRPVSLHAHDINDMKTKVLREVRTLSGHDFVLGQYTGYLQEQGVPMNSKTPTYACAALYIDNPTWAGVPFFMTAGKNLHRRRAEIRIRFKKGDSRLLFPREDVGNEIIIRIQPDEQVRLRVVSKIPGLTSDLAETSLDLIYHSKFENAIDIPDAYERLILDAAHGEKSQFVHDDQLEAAWRVFDPALKELEGETGQVPCIYPVGSRGPPEAEEFRHIHRSLNEASVHFGNMANLRIYSM